MTVLDSAPRTLEERDEARHRAEIDWAAVERSPEFRELTQRRRRFVLPATAFFLSWYLVFVLLCGYAAGFMGTEITSGLTVGYVWALTQFVMTWALGWAYLRYSARVLDPLRERAYSEAVAR
jgi:uncharacterized membrane protein (DUF485 family)